MLETVHRDPPLARLGVEVRRLALPLGVRAIVGLADARLGHLLGRQAPRRVDLGQLEVRHLPVVVGHGPADDHRSAGALWPASASSISRVNWCTLGGMKSHTRTHTSSPTRRVAM